MNMNTFQRKLVWSSSILTGASGGVYWWMENMLHPVDPWAAINHPLQPWVLKAHILVAPVMVFAVGLIAAEHIWTGWRQGVGAGRRSGAVAAGIFVPMVASGYLIQAVTHTGWLAALAWLHVGTGVIYLLGVLAHHRLVRSVLSAPRSLLSQRRASSNAPNLRGPAPRRAGSTRCGCGLP
ncbi:MAG TPA: hypothetical protein VLA36_14870 [Longimicrobiales bacterium]|nr:hypothetical protein [Longimicrobiales bacterium]